MRQYGNTVAGRMTEKRGFSSLLDSRFRIDVEPLSHLLAELYPSKHAPSHPTPGPAFNSPDPYLWTWTAGQGSGPANGTRNGTRAGRETPLLPATVYEQPQCATKNADDPKSKESLALDALLPSKTVLEQEGRRRDSNPGWRICSPLTKPLNPGGNGRLAEGAAPDAAPETGNGPITPELANVIDAWHSLPPDTRTAILAIVEATQGR